MPKQVRAGLEAMRAGGAWYSMGAVLAPLILLAILVTMRIAPSPGREPAQTHSAADSVVIFGPVSFESQATGTTQYYVETFTDPNPLEPAILLIMADATVPLSPDPDTTSSIPYSWIPEELKIRLNGTTLQVEQCIVGTVPGNCFTVRWFPTSLPRDSMRTDTTHVSQPVPLQAVNTLEVETDGSAAYNLTISLHRSSSEAITVFGPEVYERSGGAQTVTDSFSMPAGLDPPYRLHVRNGKDVCDDPPPGLTCADPTYADPAKDVRIWVNGTQVVDDNDLDLGTDSLSVPVTLLADNELQVRVVKDNGSKVTVHVTASDTMPPVLTVTSPADSAVVGADSVQIVGTVSDAGSVIVKANGYAASVDSLGNWSVWAPLPTEGPNPINIEATDLAGLSTSQALTVIRSTAPPVLTVDLPADGTVTQADSVTVSGSVTGASSVNVNGTPLSLNAGAFTGAIGLTEGPNNLVITAVAAGGAQSSEVRTVIRDTQAPTLTVNAPLDGTSTEEDTVTVSGTVTDATDVTVTANGTALPVAGDDSFTGSVPLAEGPNTILVTATDEAGNASSESRSVTRTTDPGDLPPDPATVAPPIDPTVPTTVMAATEFLYTGPDPIQTGVVPGTIELERTAALRGRVLALSGAALPGVTVSVKGHPEFGQTLSRMDGGYDLVVNGGGSLTLEYEKAGYMGADRTDQIPWQDWVVLDDVVLLQPDPQVTSIDFSDPIEVARGTPQTDADGTRQATMLFAQGTSAQMRMPDGSTQPLTSLSVRATEATVGEMGPLAMPAELPPTSAYTYAVDLQVDEAETAGAVGVEFDQPVAFYVENFAGFPVGLTVPVGRYDEQQAAWLPQPNGRIVEIVGVSAGLAEIDGDGDGNADNQAQLDSLGITQNEQQELASLYTVGTTLLRVLVTHFSWNCLSFPFGEVGFPPGQDPRQNPNEDCATTATGSIIECENLALGERIVVTGSDMTLNYRSSRTPGYQANYGLEIPFADSIPPDVLQIIVEIVIAGRIIIDTIDTPVAGGSHSFTWDRLDAFGRRLHGAPVTVTSFYVYGLTYFAAADADKAFGLNCWPSDPSDVSIICTVPNTASTRARTEISFWREWHGFLGTMGMGSAALGGWTPGHHHTYDPVRNTLYRGDGEQRTLQVEDRVLRTVAGTGVCDFTPDPGGGPATEAMLCDITGLEIAPDGSLYVTDRFHNIVQKVDTSGIITTYAGTGLPGYSGDGGPASAAMFNSPDGADLGPDGSLYVADGGNGVVRRIAPDGTISTVAGTGTLGFSGDGGPATQADFSDIYAVTVAGDGTLYILDSGNARIRRVDPEGTVETIAGTGVFGFNGDSIPANLADLNPYFGDIALGPDGSLYLADTDNHRVRRIDPSGLITTIAGTGADGEVPADGLPATESIVDNPTGVAVTADGSVYVTEWFSHRLRRVHPDGIITTVVGFGDDFCAFRENGPGTATKLCFPEDVAVGPDEGLYIGDVENHRIRKLEPFMGGLQVGDQVIASEDGSEAYVFSGLRHTETRSTLNGTLLFGFAYDSLGRLSTMTDADGLVTQVDRAPSGEATAIIAPFGQRTEVAVDTAGWLSSITNPAGEMITLVHDTLGLLESLKDPRGFEYQFTYDSLGLLERDDDPAGGFQTLTRVELASGQNGEPGQGRSIRRTTANGRSYDYGTVRLATGEKERTQTGSTGLGTNRLILRSGRREVKPPDSTTIVTVLRPDPRFGMQAPQLDSLTVTTPSGRKLQVTTRSHATVPSPSNPLVLAARVDTLMVNGRVWESAYDGAGREITVTSPMGRQYTQQLDSLNRIERVSVPGLNDLNMAYDSAGLLSSTSTASRSWQYRYDGLGRLRAIEDPLARADSFVFDAGNRIKQTIFANGDSVGFAYDSSGNMTGLTPPGRPEHTFSYTPVDLLGSYVAPGADTTGYGNTLDRELRTVIRPGGDTIAVARDTAGRPETLSFDGGQIDYAYGPQTGHVSSLTGPYAANLDFTYDGFLPTSAAWSGVGISSGSFSVTYDDDFRVTESRVNGTNPISFSYDLDGLLTSAGALTIDRDSLNGFVTGSALGSVTTSQAYSGFGEIDSYATAYSEAGLFETSYARDALGRIDTLTQVIQGDTSVYVYGYDDIGRLETVELNGSLAATYTYDRNGNRLKVAGPGGTASGTYDDQDRMLSYGSASYTYAPAGELAEMVVGSDTTRYAYDALGNLTGVELPNGTEVLYAVDALGRRIRRFVDGSPMQGFLYRDQLNPVAELDASGQVLSRFVYGTRVNVPEYMVKGGATYRIVADHLGSVRLVVDVATGTVAQRIDYDEFGRVTNNTNPGFQPFGFAGGITDDATGLVRFGARDYDPSSGRWTAPDPIRFGANDANLYSYVYQDPANLIDSFGLQATCPTVPEAPPGVDIDENIRSAIQRRYVGSAAWFAWKTRFHGAWDYKQLDPKVYEDFGNFNYGSTAEALWIPDQVANRAAGAAQIVASAINSIAKDHSLAGVREPGYGYDPKDGKPWWKAPYGDDPDDQAQIEAGRTYYNCNCWK